MNVDDIPTKGEVATKNHQEDVDPEAPVRQARAHPGHIRQDQGPAHDIGVETDIGPGLNTKI